MQRKASKGAKKEKEVSVSNETVFLILYFLASRDN